MKNKKNLGLFAILLVSSIGLTQNAHALDQIIRPYQTVREDGMGGVKLTTGVYDENFFGNPARVTDDPSWRISLLDIQVEANPEFISNLSSLTSSNGGNTLSKLSNSVGSNSHARLELGLPGYYLGKTNDHRKWSVALGVNFTSIQVDIDPRASYQVDPTIFVDSIGPALSFGYRLLDDELSVGATARAMYRFATNQTITFADLIKGGWSPTNTAGQGGTIDFDLGAEYVIPNIKPLDFQIAAAASINDVMGGNFNMFRVSTTNNLSAPPSQPRTFGFGGSARRETLGPLTDFVFALEFQDIGNDPNGSVFRTIHIGSEARWKVFTARLGINQGYLCAGIGIDFKEALQLDFATYGEEMSLNSGGEEDRRYAFRFSLKI